jgi:hypothetical protein
LNISREKAAVTPSPRTRLIALALIASTLPALSACGAGFDASVNEVTGQNSDSNLNGILARDIVIVKAPQAPTAALAGTLINSGHRADVLQTVSFTDDAPGSPTLTISPNLNLAPGQLQPLGAGNTAPISIPNAQGITVGDFVYVNLHFAQAGDMHMQVAVADRTFYFANIGGTATPTAAATQADAPGRAAFAGTQIVTDPKAPAKTPKPRATATAAPAAQPKKTAKPNTAATQPR